MKHGPPLARVPTRPDRASARRGLLLLALLGGALAGCDRTQIVTVADTDLRVPEDIDAFVLQAEQADRPVATARYALDGSEALERPVVTGFVPGGGANDAEIRFTLRGLRGSDVVLTRTISTRFDPGEVRRLDLTLLARCLQPECQTPGACGGCGASTVAPDALPRWPDPPPPRDAAVDRDAGARDGGSTDAGTRDAGPEPTLIVHYDFEVDGDPTRDASGNDRHATCRIYMAATACPTTDPDARIGASSANLDGTRGQSLPFSSALELAGPSGFTVEAWVRPSDPLNPGETNTVARLDRAAGFSLEVRDEGPPAVFFVVDGEASRTTVSAPLPDLDWTHVAARWSGGAMSLFVDGMLAMSRPQADMRLGRDAADGLRIGFGVDGAGMDGRGFQGRLDDVRLYDGALSDATILAHATP